MVRRAASSVLFALMLNVLALGNGLLALDRGPHSMAGMDMAGVPAPHQHDQQPADHGCQLPWSPGCTQLAPCAAVALISVTPTIACSVVERSAPMAVVVTAPVSVESSPDHPPPRI
jgi:hypothetical protein